MIPGELYHPSIFDPSLMCLYLCNHIAAAAGVQGKADPFRRRRHAKEAPSLSRTPPLLDPSCRVPSYVRVIRFFAMKTLLAESTDKERHLAVVS